MQEDTADLLTGINAIVDKYFDGSYISPATGRLIRRQDHHHIWKKQGSNYQKRIRNYSIMVVFEPEPFIELLEISCGSSPCTCANKEQINQRYYLSDPQSFIKLEAEIRKIGDTKQFNECLAHHTTS
jgi:hypothetical protein